MKRSEVTPEMIKRMSPEDQKRYSDIVIAVEDFPNLHPDDLTAPPEYKPQPRNQTDLERVQQREFASWLSLEDYPYCWHRTDKKSTGTLGCPDFIVAVCGVTLWIEFKRPGYRLSPDQEKFRYRLVKHGNHMHLVYSSDEAIKLVHTYDP